MKSFELAYLLAEPFVLPLHQIVRRRLRALTNGTRPTILDVGGRKSHYTIGVPARITVTDVPREREVQHQLNLGTTPQMRDQLQSRRSNVHAVLVDDMTRSALPDASFAYIVAVEVLEHVDEDEAFVRHVHRVLKPGGTFLMTTPNGDSVPNSNPDHKRHYTRAGLNALLSKYFESVDLEYAIAGGTFRTLGLRSWSLHRPWHTGVGMLANVVNAAQSSRASVKTRQVGTRHLIATARKQS